MKKTLLAIVKEILSKLDSDDVNSLGDSVEAQQVAQVVESTYRDLTYTRDIPEHDELMKLVAFSDSEKPTHMRYPENTKTITAIWYDVSDLGEDPKYRKLEWMDPFDFLCKVDSRQEHYDLVVDPASGTTLRIRNDRQPTYYTSFDDETLVFDSYDSSVDTTIQESKSRAMGQTFPVFEVDRDDFVPDLDVVMFPLLIAEATSMCFSVFKGGADPKVEQSARRNRAYIQNNMHTEVENNGWNQFGRRSRSGQGVRRRVR